ncbi:copper homeostasis protein CutC [Jonesiaceae bacterium BS-20]|uniref:PF03932 family protein CutC n=1 Tax=Jonesiaceae bacterium BS-20 TaxID=3120821 RepID=A0AAU7DWY0_9MICO
MTTLALEIAVQDAAGARIAAEFGADRIEACGALGLTGGLTPSAAALEQMLGVDIGAHALIRPRSGGFVYSPEEVDLMEREVDLCVRAGVAGVVIGALNRDKTVDEAATGRLVARARQTAAELGVERDVTFHRALDVTPDPVAALRTLAALGVDRVLTSGGAARSIDGLEVLRTMCAAGTGVQVMAGGGVRVSDVPALAAAGVSAVHLSGKALVADPGPVGPGGGAPGELEVTSAQIVAQAYQQVQSVNAIHH